MFPHSPDQHSEIDEIIKAIRHRMRYGHSLKDIANDLGRFISQDKIYICYAAAAIMERDYGRNMVGKIVF